MYRQNTDVYKINRKENKLNSDKVEIYVKIAITTLIIQFKTPAIFVNNFMQNTAMYKINLKENKLNPNKV